MHKLIRYLIQVMNGLFISHRRQQLGSDDFIKIFHIDVTALSQETVKIAQRLLHADNQPFDMLHSE